MTWKGHETDASKDEWYILPSSNLENKGMAIVLEDPNDLKMGWANAEGDNSYVATDLGTSDYATWKFERVTDFDDHIDELLEMYNFEDCVIYDRELAALMRLIMEKSEVINANADDSAEEAAFNEIYYAILNYTGRMPEQLMAPNPGFLYTIRPAVEEFTENALLVHTDWTNNTYTSKEIYLDDVINDEGEGKISYDSRSAWVFEGATGSANSGLKAKNLHTQCYMTALGADKSVVNEEGAATVTLNALGACTTMFQVGDEYMAMSGAKVTNTGDADLYIHQIFTSCRCTGKEYPTHAIKPGAQDSIIVIFNGEKSAPRKFRTSITVHSNAKTEMTKVYIKGEMLPAKVQELEVIEIEE